jgi:hypothetical protein
MFRTHDISSYQALISTGDTVDLIDVPREQLQQTLCSALVFIQRAESRALRLLAVTSALRGQAVGHKSDLVVPVSSSEKELDRYDPEDFHAENGEGVRICVADMDMDLLRNSVARAFTVLHHIDTLAHQTENDMGRWVHVPPAYTIGPKLKQSIERAAKLKPCHVMDSATFYSRFRQMGEDHKKTLIHELGIFEDVPDHATSREAFGRATFIIRHESILPLALEIMDRIAPLGP